MTEYDSDKVRSIEKHFPVDVLPTARFISTLPGMDHDYSEWVGSGAISWNGVTMINGEQIRIQITHLHQSTTFQLVGERRTERWELDEEYCRELTFSRKRALLPGTVLNDTDTISVGETHSAVLNFCDDKERFLRRDICDKCPFQTEDRLKKGTKTEKNLFGGGYREVVEFSFQRPSDLPLRRTRDVNREKSALDLKGFRTIDDAIASLSLLRDAIKSATPLLSQQTAPIPSSQSLTSDIYFQ